ncbi:MAG: HupE/UreJ family protein [Flavicella sp.]
MQDFFLYFKLGLEHVLDLNAYDHILFLIVLVVAYNFKQWKALLWLVTSFTIGHSLSLALSAYKFIAADPRFVEFLIPLTIVITALINVFSGTKNGGLSKIVLFISFCFGWIHGLGFSFYFKMLLDASESKLVPLLEFSLGIEAAQLLVVVGISIVYSLLHNLFRVAKRDWIIVLSSIVIGIAIPMLIERYDAFLSVF